MEDSLRSDKIQVEKKQFFFDLKENPRGRFLRITEDCNGRRDSIIIPAAGMEEFLTVVEEMVRFNADEGDDSRPADGDGKTGDKPWESEEPRQ